MCEPSQRISPRHDSLENGKDAGANFGSRSGAGAQTKKGSALSEPGHNNDTMNNSNGLGPHPAPKTRSRSITA